MSDQRDPRIRALIVELSASSPEAPTFAEIEDRAVEPVGDGPVRPLGTLRQSRARGWGLGAVAAAALVVLLVIGGPLLVLERDINSDVEVLAPVDVETTVTAPPTTITSDLSTVAGGATPGVVWTGPVDPIALTLDPAVVPAEIGTVTVTVTGRSPDDIWVMVCSGARGVVDAADWPPAAEIPGGVCGEVSREAGTLTNPKLEGGAFEATLQVPIDAEAIEEGGVVITAGDIWVPLRGNALLQVADDATGESDWLDDVVDVAIAPDGSIFVAALMGVASLDASGEWTLVDLTGLPEGSGLEGGLPGRVIDMITVGQDGELWVAGSASSAEDDQQFGGVVNDWIGGRYLTWIARHDCDPEPCAWRVFTSDEVPDLAGGVGDIAVSDGGTVFASVGENLLLAYHGTDWESHTVAGFGNVGPWSGSIAVAPNGVLWAGTNSPDQGRGLLSFDGTEIVRYTTEDGLPSDNAFQVAVADDGSIWVATDTLYNNPSTAMPDQAAGVARYDGTTWTTYTMEDGLLSNDAVIATGADGTVWAIHYEIPPYGYARFNGTTWTTYPTDQLVGGFRAAVDANGTLWTSARGELVSFDGTTRTTFPSPFPLP